MMPLFFFRVLAVLWLLVASVQAEETPILQLDTGGHLSIIRDLVFTPDGKFLVSAADDKVIRVWDWRVGKTVRTIRGQSGAGNEGKIFAMALSPNGQRLAVAGWMHRECPGRCGDIRLYNFASGELTALLKGHTDVVDSLAFSPDGRQLISGSKDGTAILWDAGIQRVLHRLQGHRDDVNAVSFSADGTRAVTGSQDKTLRLWRVSDGALLALMSGHASGVSALAVSPKDAVITSGDGIGQLRAWDGQTGAFIAVLANQGGMVGSLRFSPDGRLLLSTCGHTGCGFKQRIYDAASGQQLAAYAKHDNAVVAGAFSPDGRVAAAGGGGNQEVHIWDVSSGETRAVQKGTGKPGYAVGFSADNRTIAWGTTDPCPGERSCSNEFGRLEHLLSLPITAERLSEPERVKGEANWERARTKVRGVSLLHRKGPFSFNAVLDIFREGKPFKMFIERGPADGYGHWAYGLSPDGNAIVSGGSNGVLMAYSPAGKPIGAFVGHEEVIWSIAVSPNGRYLVSGSADQTLRLWNLKTRELLVTMFRGEDGEWVMWTPQGYYAGSPGADKIVGWQINRGPDKAADYVTAEQLRKHLNRPDIVAKAIQLASAEEAVRTSYGTEFKLSDLLARPAPRLRILSPAADSTVNAAGGIAVKIALDATPDPVTRIRIQVNGRQLDDFLPERGPKFEPSKEHSFNVPLAKGKNTIVVTALNEIGWSKVQDGTLSLTNQSAGALDKRGTLYILAIGVSKYPGVAHMCRPKPSCDLDFTGADAIAFADSLEARLGALHEKVVRRVLVNEGRSDGAPTAANIVDALGVLAEAQANDTVAVFLAGHGANEGPNYRFIPTDAAVANGAVRPSSVVPWYAIEEAIDSAKGRRLLFIDTCHSAGAYNERLGNAAYYANILAYSSARWDQVAWESPKLGHGFFTEAIVEGLAGKADASGGGRVDTAQLNAYLQARVRELAKAIGKEQDPQFFKGRDAEDYTLAVLH
ncbi:MAG: caspase family protein [Rhodomicrobium sp.]